MNIDLDRLHGPHTEPGSGRTFAMLVYALQSVADFGVPLMACGFARWVEAFAAATELRGIATGLGVELDWVRSQGSRVVVAGGGCVVCVKFGDALMRRPGVVSLVDHAVLQMYEAAAKQQGTDHDDSNPNDSDVAGH